MTTLIVDANVIVSAILGKSLPLVAATLGKGFELLAPAPQLAEAAHVLAKRGLHPDEVERGLAAVREFVGTLPLERFSPSESSARQRLHARGQPDWPVLAAALELLAAIWSNDKDFRGVGVAVWSTRNVPFAEPRQPARVGRSGELIR